METLPESVTRFVGSHPSISVDDGGVVAGTIVFNDESAVIDTLLYFEDAKQLLNSLKNKDITIKAVINTHWHADHNMGNQFFDQSKLISHDNCPSLMKTSGEKMIESAKKNIPGEAERLKDYKQVFPTKTFSDSLNLPIHDSNLVLYHMPGHTPDSIVAYLPELKILFAGDTVMDLPYIWHGDRNLLLVFLH